MDPPLSAVHKPSQSPTTATTGMETPSAPPRELSESPGTASAGDPATIAGSILHNAQNTNISGGNFVITNNVNANDGHTLKVLHKHVAPNAILNAGGRADEVRCHPGTREEVLRRVDRWRAMQDGDTNPIFWLSGPAGAGKTAIVQTTAEVWGGLKVPHANFFFFRGDSSRRNSASLIATLLHQIVLFYPSIRQTVAAQLTDNPLIFDSVPLHEQLSQLIVTPLRAIQQTQSSSYRPLIIMIDGLDECDSSSKCTQQQILSAFDKILLEQPCPIQLLVASRDEFHIRTAFNGLGSPVTSLYLDDEYSPERDIRIFVQAQFERIKRTHALAHTLDDAWPSVQDVEYIVQKSSGQFIYAATVMRYISNSSVSPIISLERVQGVVPATANSPFSHLDAIYTHILSQAGDQESLRDLMVAQLIRSCVESVRTTGDCPSLELSTLLRNYDAKYTEAMIHSCVSDITSIAQYKSPHELHFYHASFPDFLQDPSRSGDYFVDNEGFNFQMMAVVWERITDRMGKELGTASIAQLAFCQPESLPPNFLDILGELTPLNLMQLRQVDDMMTAFIESYNSCACEGDIIKYKQIIRRWACTLWDSDIDQDPTLLIEDDLEVPPCSRRYIAMTIVARQNMAQPTGSIATALCPQTEFDTREIGLWLNNHLSELQIQRKYSTEPQLLQKRIKEWSSWAVKNSISVDDLEQRPRTLWYMGKKKVGKWVSRLITRGDGISSTGARSEVLVQLDCRTRNRRGVYVDSDFYPWGI